jgi:thiol-disulfide isomerase/thioredoxin
MKVNFLILSIIASLCFGWVYYESNKPPNFSQEQQEIKQGSASLPLATDFTYTTLKGRTGKLSNHKGHTILLHFWASWCAPCIVEFPELIRLAQAQQDDIIVLAVSTDENKADIQKFLKKLKADIPSNFILIHDQDKTISHDLYQTIKLPETYIISPTLRIRKKLIGPQNNWNSTILQEQILPRIQ